MKYFAAFLIGFALLSAVPITNNWRESARSADAERRLRLVEQREAERLRQVDESLKFLESAGVVSGADEAYQSLVERHERLEAATERFKTGMDSLLEDVK